MPNGSLDSAMLSPKRQRVDEPAVAEIAKPPRFSYNNEYMDAFMSQLQKNVTFPEQPQLHVTQHDPDVERCFERITTEIKRTWQANGKRAVQLPQLESLVNYIRQRVDFNAGVLVVELGAGKGLLGRLLGELCPGTSVVPLDCRGLNSSYDDGHNERVQTDLAECDLGAIVDEHCKRVGAKRVVFLAKHLCGNATDAALESIAKLSTPGNPFEWQVEAVFLAPCCHPKAAWEKLYGRELLSQWGLVKAFPEQNAKEHHVWASVIQFLVISKFGAGYKPETDCKSWNAVRRCVPEAWRQRELGRKCRWLVEQARMEKLAEATGLRGQLVQYVPEAVSPDNLLIVLAREERDVPAPAEDVPVGVVMRILADQSRAKASAIPNKIADYLLERRARDPAARAAGLAGASVVTLGDGLGKMGSTEAAVFVRGSNGVAPLTSYLASLRLVGRVAGMLLPVDQACSSLDEVDVGAFNFPVRTSAAPKLPLLERVCNGGARCGQSPPASCLCLSPSAFESIWSVVQVVDGLGAAACGGGNMYHWSCLPRGLWNPKEWREMCQTQREAARWEELTERLKDFGVGTGTVCVAGRENWRGALEAAGVTVLEGSADGYLVDYDDEVSFEKATKLGKELTLGRAGAWVAIRLSYRQTRYASGKAKRAAETAFRKSGVAQLTPWLDRVELLHLLTDREAERTAIGVVRADHTA